MLFKKVAQALQRLPNSRMTTHSLSQVCAPLSQIRVDKIANIEENRKYCVAMMEMPKLLSQ
jgi:hypothetical protein